MESYSVEAVLKASGASKFSSDFKNATRNVEGLDRSTGKANFTIGKLLGAVGITAAVAKGFQLVKNSVDLAFRRIDTMEQFERVMTTMTGSVEKANEVLEATNQAVLGTAYGLDVGAQAVQNFVTSNMEVDTATDTIARWGDAVAFYGDGSNETLASVSDALAKMTAKGRVQMDNMNRLTERGIPAMQIYADAVGKSVEEVSNQMSEGGLSADEFITVMNDALQNGTKNFASIDGAAKEAGASWSGSFANMRAAVARGVTKIIGSIDELLTDSGLPDMRGLIGDFGKQAEKVLNHVAENIPRIIDRFKEWYESIQPHLPLIKGIAIAVGSFVATMATLNTVIRTAQAIWAVFNAVILANPIVAIIAAIVSAAVLIYVYWKPISKFFKDLWETIKEFGIGVWESLMGVWQSTVDFFKNIWKSIGDFFKNLWGDTKDSGMSVWNTLKKAWKNTVDFFMNIWNSTVGFFTNLWSTVRDVFVSTWTTISDAVMNILQPFIDIIVNTFSNMWNNVKAIFESFGQYYRGVWELIKNLTLGPILLIFDLVTGNFEALRDDSIAIFNNIKNAIATIWEGIKGVFVGVINFIKDFFSGFFEFMVTLGRKMMETLSKNIKENWDKTKEIFATVLNYIKDLVSSAFNFIVTFIPNAMRAVWNWIVSIWDSIKSAFTAAVDFIKNAIRNGFNSFVDNIKKNMDRAKDTISNIWNSVMNFFKGINLKDIGKNLIQGFINGIKGMFNAVKNTISSITKFVPNTIRKVLGIRSPSVLFEGFGINLFEGFNIGMEKERRNVVNVVRSISERVKSAFDPQLGVSDIASQVDTINAQANRQISSNLDSEITVNNRQPAYINLSLGGRDYEAFVEDISDTQDRNTRVREAFA